MCATWALSFNRTELMNFLIISNIFSYDPNSGDTEDFGTNTKRKLTKKIFNFLSNQCSIVFHGFFGWSFHFTLRYGIRYSLTIDTLVLILRRLRKLEPESAAKNASTTTG